MARRRLCWNWKVWDYKRETMWSWITLIGKYNMDKCGWSKDAMEQGNPQSFVWLWYVEEVFCSLGVESQNIELSPNCVLYAYGLETFPGDGGKATTTATTASRETATWRSCCDRRSSDWYCFNRDSFETSHSICFRKNRLSSTLRTARLQVREWLSP